MPPVSAQNRKAIAVQLLAVDADDDFFSRQRGVTPSVLAAVPVTLFLGHTPVHLSRAACAPDNVNADFEVRD